MNYSRESSLVTEYTSFERDCESGAGHFPKGVSCGSNVGGSPAQHPGAPDQVTLWGRGRNRMIQNIYRYTPIL